MKTDFFYKDHVIGSLPLNLVDELLHQCGQSQLTQDERARILTSDPDYPVAPVPQLSIPELTANEAASLAQ